MSDAPSAAGLFARRITIRVRPLILRTGVWLLVTPHTTVVLVLVRRHYLDDVLGERNAPEHLF